MTKGRLEAFSDGVIAIIITIMVLELRAPHGADLAALRAVIPAFLTYVLSFAFLGIYWSNHHHMLHVVDRVNGAILWANLHLLFWLSLIPIVTGWMGQNHFASVPTAVYGAVLLCDAIATYADKRRYPSFDTFAEKMIANMRFNGYSREAVLAPAVRARFDETVAASGDNFDQPVRIDCFGPAA